MFVDLAHLLEALVLELRSLLDAVRELGKLLVPTLIPTPQLGLLEEVVTAQLTEGSWGSSLGPEKPLPLTVTNEVESRVCGLPLVVTTVLPLGDTFRRPLVLRDTSGGVMDAHRRPRPLDAPAHTCTSITVPV